MRKSFLSQLLLLTCLLAAPGVALAAAGDLVPAFGTGGVVTNNPSISTDRIKGIAIDTTWMYIVGQDLGSGFRWRIEKRSITTGGLDGSFGSGGVITYDVPFTDDYAHDIAIDASRMYVTGTTVSGASWAWRIEKRSLSNGSLEASFGTSGAVTTNLSSAAQWPNAIAINSSWMFVVGSEGVAGANSKWRIEKRSLADGSLDGSFGVGGVITIDPNPAGDDTLSAIAIDLNWMYIAGVGTSQWRIEKRSLTNGSLDSSFGAGGVITSSYPPPVSVTTIAIDSSWMYVGGSDYTPGNSEWRIEKRSLTNGSLDNSFGSGGMITSNPTALNDYIKNLAIDSSAMYVLGQQGSSAVNSQWRIEKRALIDGVLDSAFGVGGVVISDPITPDPGADEPFDIAIDSTAIYAVGSDYIPGNSEWRVEKRELGGGAYVDCGLRMYDGTTTVTLSCEDPAVSPLRVQKGATTYGINIVDPADPNASRIRVQTPAGVKALRKQ